MNVLSASIADIPSPHRQQDENIGVRQRNMLDGAGGLAVGIVVSLAILLLGFSIVNVKDSTGMAAYLQMTAGFGLYSWMVVVTALLLGVLIYVYMLVDFINKQPKQISASATVT
jgi:hypothetical protein